MLGDFGSDYTFNPTIPLFKYTSNNTLDDITFSPVTSLQDNFIEGNEIIRLIALTEYDDVLRVSTSQQTTTITIIDDDCKYNDEKLVHLLLRERKSLIILRY